MGTLPDQDPPLGTKFIRGVEGIKVELIDYNVNPYKSLYVMATSCWGKKINKWDETEPEHRFEVVKAVLTGNALPLALEAPVFTFAIEGPSRAAFDQLARTRLGAVFSARGVRDNNWKDASIRVPTCLWPLYDHEETILVNTKEMYADIVNSGKASWQAARFCLPMNIFYGWSVSYNYNSLRGVCANRMKFCEMEDTVATAWLMKKAVDEKFPLLGNYLRPGCDYAGKCQYHRSYTLSEMFGCLFKECGRNPCPDSNDYSEFNEVCTNYGELEEQLDVHITHPNEWLEYENYEDLAGSDKGYFEDRVSRIVPSYGCQESLKEGE
jgi:thymidylate synthase ThyX